VSGRLRAGAIADKNRRRKQAAGADVALFGDQVFDFVIVGGGSAGCVAASRLTERSSNTVLLLEIGEDFQPGSEPPEIRDSFAGTAHSNPRFTWPGFGAFFAPRPGNAPDNRERLRYAQGRVIGGGSSVNGMISNRGLPSDYDGWAAAGAAGWAWDDVLPFFRKLETDLDYDGPLHGKDGPMKLLRTPEAQWPGFTRAMMKAVEEEGWRNIRDQNAAFGDGFFPVAIANIDDKRISAATAYLGAVVRQRPNLTILGETGVERILFEGLRATGVRAHRRGESFDIRAREVLVSSGAMRSPVLLLRSGIGPAAEIAQHGIAVVADRPGVGKNLMEHPGVNFGATMKKAARMPPALRKPLIAGLRWSSNVETCPPGDMYLIPMNKAVWHDVGSQLGIIMMWINRSHSTGEVRLASADWRADPIVDFDMCSDWRDMERLKIGTRLMFKLQAKPVLREAVHEIFPVSYSKRARKYQVYNRSNEIQTWIGARLMDASGPARRWIVDNLISEGPTIADLMADETVLESWIRATVYGHYHASCSNRMGTADDRFAVTDPSARVYGVAGLRVCDASLMVTVPCANTNIPTIMVGEKVAATILAEQKTA